MKLDEYHSLVRHGVLGPIEYLNGHVVVGAYDFVFSPAQAAAARELGIDVPDCVDAVLGEPALRAEVAARLGEGI